VPAIRHGWCGSIDGMAGANLDVARAAATVLISVVVVVCGAGCGGASKHTATKSGAASSAATTGSATSAQTSASASTNASTSSAKTNTPRVQPLAGPTVSGSSGALRASLHGDNHAPKAGKLWHYAVLATDASGHAVGGTVDTEFVFGGAVVGHESPPTHRLRNGRLNDSVTYPARSIGLPLTFRVVVHTGLGTVTLNWPVKVTR
jgi:hypothetical protein